MDYVIAIIIGALLYYAFAERKKSSGVFVIDLREDAEQPIQLKMDVGLNSIYTKKHVLLDVKVLEDDSLN